MVNFPAAISETRQASVHFDAKAKGLMLIEMRINFWTTLARVASLARTRAFRVLNIFIALPPKISVVVVVMVNVVAVWQQMFSQTAVVVAALFFCVLTSSIE